MAGVNKTTRRNITNDTAVSSAVYTAPNETTRSLRVLEHLVDDSVQFEPEVIPTPERVRLLEKTTPQELFESQISTADWLADLGAAPDPLAKAQNAEANRAFTALATQATPEEQKAALTKLNTPAAVRHLVGMLTAYDWKFVEQANELRGYAVSQLLEETKHPDAKVRLKALELLGKVTEVALFTDRVEVKKVDMTDAELDRRIKEKLERLAKIVDVTDVVEVEIIEEEKQRESGDEPDPA